MTDESPVLLHEHPVANGAVLAQAELNVEATLNALSLEMARILDKALRGWLQRAEVAAVVITGKADKAFCAGGDIQALYHAVVANHAADAVVDDYPFKFFAEEYRLDYLLHTYAKPVITVGHGIVMGGGLGIFSGSRYRVLTEKSRLAVPEITIGLFPDAGATWTLTHMAPHHAAFLGLTGSHVNAADSLTTGMGHYVVAQEQRHDLLAQLLKLPWQGQAEADHELTGEFLSGLAGSSLAPQALPPAELDAVPERQINTADLAAEEQALLALEGASSWVDRGLANLRGGCPTTAGIVLEQLRRAPGMTLADMFRMELTVATHCAYNNDFKEGVRALLIDKDNQPDWAYGSIGNLDWQHVLSHFEPPWPQHPLADLGESTS